MLQSTDFSYLCLEGYWNKAPVHKHLAVNDHSAAIIPISILYKSVCISYFNKITDLAYNRGNVNIP